MGNEDIVYSGTVYGSGFRYVVGSSDDMMTIGYREDGESDAYDHEKDIIIGWDDAAGLAVVIGKLVEMNRRPQ